jgi:hypothetical protein
MSSRHTRSCPAYGNYQPPYEECDCGAEASDRKPFDQGRDPGDETDHKPTSTTVEAPSECPECGDKLIHEPYGTFCVTCGWNTTTILEYVPGL